MLRYTRYALIGAAAGLLGWVGYQTIRRQIQVRRRTANALEE